MKRRSFLGGLLGAAPAAAVAAVSIPEKPKGVTWTTACGMCKEKLTQFVDLSGPVSCGTQCPKCLAVLDTMPLAALIHEHNGRDKYGRPI